jgi:hypothetical protein
MLDRGSPFGHAAIDINGTVYSRHHSGWLVESRSAYLDRQQNIRDTVGLLLDTSWLEDDAVENYIQDRINGGSEYDLLSDSCSSNLSDALDEIGVTTTGPWQYGGISPADLLINLPKTGRVTNRYLYERRN